MRIFNDIILEEASELLSKLRFSHYPRAKDAIVTDIKKEIESAEESISSLVRVLKKSEVGRRKEAAVALGEIGVSFKDMASEVVGPLLRALEDNYESVSLSAAAALGRVASTLPNSIEKYSTVLVEIMKDKKMKPQTRRGATYALRKIDNVPLLESLSVRPVEKLLRSVMSEGGNKILDVLELSIIATEEEVPFFLHLAEDRNHPMDTRIEAILALGRLTYEGAITPLEEIMGDEDNELVREAILNTLVQLKPDVYLSRTPSKSFFKSGENVEALIQIFDEEDGENFELLLMLFNLKGDSNVFQFRPVSLIGAITSGSFMRVDRFNRLGATRFYKLRGGNYSFLSPVEVAISKLQKPGELVKRSEVAVGAAEVTPREEYSPEFQADNERLKCTVRFRPMKDDMVDLILQFEYEDPKIEKKRLKFALFESGKDKVVEVKRGEETILLEGTITLDPKRKALLGRWERHNIICESIPDSMEVRAFISLFAAGRWSAQEEDDHIDDYSQFGFIEGNLNPEERQNVEDHLKTCESCKAEMDSLMKIEEKLQIEPNIIKVTKDYLVEIPKAMARIKKELVKRVVILFPRRHTFVGALAGASSKKIKEITVGNAIKCVLVYFKPNLSISISEIHNNLKLPNKFELVIEVPDDKKTYICIKRQKRWQCEIPGMTISEFTEYVDQGKVELDIISEESQEMK